MLKMQIDLTSMARRCYNVIKRRCFNVKIRRPHYTKTFTLKRRCENVENANRLTSIARRCYNVIKRRYVKIGRQSDVDNFASK